MFRYRKINFTKKNSVFIVNYVRLFILMLELGKPLSVFRNKNNRQGCRIEGNSQLQEKENFSYRFPNLRFQEKLNSEFP